MWPVNHGLYDFLKLHQILQRTFIRHDHALRAKLQTTWEQQHKWGLSIPRPDVLNYLGNDCCMYFEFVTFYTWSIVCVASVGLLLFLGGKTTSGPWMLGFVLFTGIWSSVVLGLWSQRQYALEQLWKPSQAQSTFLSLDAFDLYDGSSSTAAAAVARRSCLKWRRLLTSWARV